MTWSTLPPEICAVICQELKGLGGNIAPLCLTSRNFWPEAQRALYHSLDLQGLRCIDSWSRTICCQGHLAERIYALVLRFPDAPVFPPDATTIVDALHRCVNLKELHIFDDGYAVEDGEIVSLHRLLLIDLPFRLHKFEYRSKTFDRLNPQFLRNQTEIRILSIPNELALPTSQNPLLGVIALATPSLQDLPQRPWQRIETKAIRDFTTLAPYSQTLTILNVQGHWGRRASFSMNDTLNAIGDALPSLRHLGMSEQRKVGMPNATNAPQQILRQKFPMLETFILEVRNIEHFLYEIWFSTSSYDMAIPVHIQSLGTAILHACPTLWRVGLGAEVVLGSQLTCVLTKADDGAIKAEVGTAFNFEELSMFWKD
ncbi:hypothetical protein R3P38DRAFT_2499949 [Favolaschia claudopus]|uniref:F-box domain-containing protein n=1 Tax=Favolaschia claudopus TaxID=2862362 RepID=A0AAW0DS94_9AGAR